MHCIALHCIALHCIAVNCITLHCILLYCIVLYCIVLYCIVLYCIALHCTALPCTALHCSALHYTASHRIALHCIVLYYIVLICLDLVRTTGNLSSYHNLCNLQYSARSAARNDSPTHKLEVGPEAKKPFYESKAVSTRHFSEPGVIDRALFAPVARVRTGETGTLIPVSRDYLATWNERARSIAIGRALSTLSYGRSTGR